MTCRDDQVHADKQHVVSISDATAVGPRIFRGQLGQPHHKQATVREVCYSHAATVAKVGVVVGGHNGVAEPGQGAQAAPVLPLVPVDGRGGVMALDGDSFPRLPRHQPRALQCIGSLQQAQYEDNVHFPSCLLVGNLWFSGVSWGLFIHLSLEIKSTWTVLSLSAMLAVDVL